MRIEEQEPWPVSLRPAAPEPKGMASEARDRGAGALPLRAVRSPVVSTVPTDRPPPAGPGTRLEQRGARLALGALLFASALGLALEQGSPLEPVAAVIMERTPVEVANWLIETLGPLGKPLAMLGAAFALVSFGSLLGLAVARGLAPVGAALLALAVGATALRLLGPIHPLPLAAIFGALAALIVGPPPAGLRRIDSRSAAASDPIRGESRSGRGEGDAACTRRRLLGHGGAVALGALLLPATALVTEWGRGSGRRGPSGEPLPGRAFVPPSPRRDGFALDGLTPEVTPVADFYVMSKNLEDPAVDAGSWRLRVGGAVARPLTLDFAAVSRLPEREVWATLRCVSNTVGGRFMGTALWTGTPLPALVAACEPVPDARSVVLRGRDGHFEMLPLAELHPESLLAWGQNGRYLAREHGFPLRALVPGRYGFKNVKWLDSIELRREWEPGYWARRGWTDGAIVRTVARIDLARVGGPGQAIVAGVAFAGDRGIRAVEVRANRGPWQPADLHVPPLSPLTWTQWRAELPASGSTVFEARAVDGLGQPQSEAPAGPFPDGAAGYHRFEVSL